MTTNEPRVSREHLIALAQKCDLLTGYRTREMVDAIAGYAYVVLNDKAVQEAFALANPRPVLDTLTQEISAMKRHCVEARQALDINDFAHCAYEIDAALKVGADSTAYDEEKHGPRFISVSERMCRDDQDSFIPVNASQPERRYTDELAR